MGRYRRAVVVRLSHYIRVGHANRGILFRNDADYREYVRLLSAACRTWSVKLRAWCLMPGRLSLVACPGYQDSLSRAMAEANGRYTRHYNAATKTSGILFARRYNCCVLDWPRTIAAVRLVETEPAREGLVKKPWQWKWSSAAMRASKREPDELCGDPTLEGSIRDWRSFFYNQADPENEELILRSARRDRPAGDEQFIKATEVYCGQRLRKHKTGPKKPRKEADR